MIDAPAPVTASRAKPAVMDVDFATPNCVILIYPAVPAPETNCKPFGAPANASTPAVEFAPPPLPPLLLVVGLPKLPEPPLPPFAFIKTVVANIIAVLPPPPAPEY